MFRTENVTGFWSLTVFFVHHKLRYSAVNILKILHKFKMVGRCRFRSLSSKVCQTRGKGVEIQ